MAVKTQISKKTITHNTFFLPPLLVYYFVVKEPLVYLW